MVGLKNATRILSLLAAVAVLGCNGVQITDINVPGASDDDDDIVPTPTPGPDPAIYIAASGYNMDLGAVKDLPFTVKGFNGFTGDITVTASNLPAGVTAAGPVTVNVPAPDVDVAGVISLTSTRSTAVPGKYAAVALDAVSGVLTANTPVTIDVNAAITLLTRNDVLDGSAVTNFFGYDVAAGGLTLHLGNASEVKVSWVNKSPTEHRIHGNGTSASPNNLVSNGGADLTLRGDLSHSAGGQGALDSTFTRTLHPSNPTVETVVDYYCHTHGTQQPGQIHIVP